MFIVHPTGPGPGCLDGQRRCDSLFELVHTGPNPMRNHAFLPSYWHSDSKAYRGLGVDHTEAQPDVHTFAVAASDTALWTLTITGSCLEHLCGVHVLTVVH